MDHDHIGWWLANVASFSAITMTLLGVLPAVAAVVAGLWYGIQIYESETVTRWVKYRRQRKIARLKARLVVLQAECDDLTSTLD